MGLFPGNGNFTDSGQSLGSSLSMDVKLGDVDSDLDAFVANRNQGNHSTASMNNRLPG